VLVPPTDDVPAKQALQIVPLKGEMYPVGQAVQTLLVCGPVWPVVGGKINPDPRELK